MYRYFLILTLIFLFSSSCASSISSSETLDSSSYSSEQSTASAFEQFTNDLFVEWVQTDTLNLHYKLSSPATYNITPSNITLGNLTPSSLQEEYHKMKESLNTLYSFPYKDLSSAEQFTYDILEDYLTSHLKLEDFILYEEPLGATLGIQSQLPILLSEYAFESESDIQTYLLLLEDIDNYFLSILEFESQKKEAGLFMENRCLESILEQCTSFCQVDEIDNHLLIQTFIERLDNLSFDLTDDIKLLYCKQNKEIIQNTVIPAYKMLADGLSLFKNSCQYEGGLCNKPNGKKYYELLVYQKTGSNKSVSTLFEQTKQRISKNMLSIASLIQSDESLMDQLSNYTFSLSDPETILNTLQTTILQDFPQPTQTSSASFSIKQVADSLSKFTSPAFYIIPPIDNPSRNIIYINSANGLDKLFPILAHEGFPGHLYQHTWFSSSNQYPIRELLSYIGYTEGWATYSELYSYQLENQFSSNFINLLIETEEATLGIYSLMDIGIHYYGWTLEEIKQTLLKYFGISDTAIIESIYTTLLETPANYLSYYIGYTEMLELKNYAQKKWKNDFSLLKFHTQVLNLGPAPFYLIKNAL